MCAINSSAQTLVSGTISDQTWTLANSPYIVVGDILVNKLEIQPGVKVLFNGDYIFEIAGRLTAIGTTQDSIIFSKTDSTFGWRGIFFNFSPLDSGIAYCKIEYATNGGITFDHTSQTIKNCTIANNSTSGNGGGIYVTAGSMVTVNNCTITNNKVTAFANDGGGVYSEGTAILNNCVITRNSSNGSFGPGGGISVTSGGVGILNNCIIANNSAQCCGGGIYNSSASVTVTNCTIVSNTNDAIRNDFGTITVENSILFFNTASQIFNNGGTANVTYSNIQLGFTGQGNINVNPVFDDDSTFVISRFSPCVDAGNPASAFFDGCRPPAHGTERNDMGAYGGPGTCGWLSEPPTGINDINSNRVPQFYLAQNYPNPFNPETIICYAIPTDEIVTLKIYNLLGNEIETLVNRKQSPGEYELQWNPIGLPSGVYVYRLKAGEFVTTRKLVLVR